MIRVILDHFGHFPWLVGMTGVTFKYKDDQEIQHMVTMICSNCPLQTLLTLHISERPWALDKPNLDFLTSALNASQQPEKLCPWKSL